MRYRIRLLAFLALIGLIVTGCSEPVRESPRLRIFNYGEHDIEDLVVGFPDSRIDFGAVPAGATSAYKDAPRGVYPYGAYQFRMDGLQQRQPVTDFVGVAPMPDGSYTYVIEFVPDRFPRGKLRHEAVLRGDHVIFSVEASRNDLVASAIRENPGRFSFGEKFEIEGQVLRSRGNEDCWSISPDGAELLLEFDELPLDLQVEGLSVRATVHIEEGKFGKCSRLFRIFADTIEAVE